MPIDLALSRILRLLCKLGNPHIHSYKSVHVAGTNGKGSTLAYLSSVLTQANIRNGRFTSPHILSYNDCISINGEEYPQRKFDEVRKLVMKEDQIMGLACTEFEILTATAFKIFEMERIDLALVEVGLGGRLDATNVLEPPKEKKNEGGVIICAITKIGMDHEGLLGDSLSAIAQEKAGIIKTGVPVVVDASNEKTVLQTITDKAHQVHAEIHLAERESDSSPWLKASPLKGDYQGSNLSVALHIIELLKDRFGYDSLTQSAISTGIEKTSWPARLQMVRHNNLEFLLDGAHNESAAEELGTYLESHIESRRTKGIIFVIALSEGKHIQNLLKHIVTSENDTIVPTSFTPPDGMPWVRCYTPKHIAAAAKSYAKNVKLVSDYRIENIFEELHRIKLTGDDRSVVICGSLYLCSDVLRYIQNA